MQKIELKKIDNKIALDTKVESCWDDCIHSRVSGYNEALLGYGCTVQIWRSAKSCWFW